MLNVNDAPGRAKWEVLWIDPRVKGIKRKKFDHSLVGAIEFYMKASNTSAKAVTLRCQNMGFPPPEHLQKKLVRGKKNGKIVQGYVDPMRKHNLTGIYWCPYCMKLRRFVQRKYIGDGNHKMADNVLACPMCSVNQRDHNVRKYNPMMVIHRYELENSRVRAPTRTVASRRAARRRKKKTEEE